MEIIEPLWILGWIALTALLVGWADIEKYRIALLNTVPYFMRSWPLIKKFYWQKEDIERARQRAKEISEKLNWD